MSSKDWRQWLKLTRKQLRQLGRTIEEELGYALERHLPTQSGKMVRVPVPVPVPVPVRNIPTRSPLKYVGYRNLHHSVKPVENLGYKYSSNGARIRGLSKSGVSLFSSSSRTPRGTPRGLFTNWNMSSTRFSTGRMYSTASIKFTHEAVNNMSLSLRCFFNSLNSAVTASDGKHFSSKNRKLQNEVSIKLSKHDISLIRDMEIFEMINHHKNGCFYAGSETIGSFVEFQMPKFDLEDVVPSMVFANASTLDSLQLDISKYTKSLNAIGEAVRRIYDNYGSLPMTFAEDRLRVHFPNLTMQETERLITELHITIGCVHPDSNQCNIAPYGEDNILSNSGSVNDFSSVNLTYSPVLSESCSPFDSYQVI